MGWRVRRSKKMGPVRVTASKSGLSYSIGGPGARYTVRSDGKQQVTVGIPGSGISYTETFGQSKKSSSNKTASSSSQSSKTSSSTGNIEYTVDVIAAQLEKVRQERELVQTGLNCLLIGLLFVSPILLLLALVPVLNAILGVLLAIPFFSVSKKLGELEQQEQRLLQLLDDAESMGYDNDPLYDDYDEDGYEPAALAPAPSYSTAPVRQSAYPETSSSKDLIEKIEDLNRKLLKATEMFGDDHPKVADCLEEMAALLRKAKIRTLDAANMEARARVIRSSAG